MHQAFANLLPTTWRDAIRDARGARVYARRAYSQEGEDLVLQRIFEKQLEGIYVDVGAHHPFRFSNTQLLHERGWRGINIDAMPGSMAMFRRFRPHDINLELGIGVEHRTLEFHVFQEAALNTFDSTLAGDRIAMGWKRERTVPVPCLPLKEVLVQHLPALGKSTIDLLTIDVEGFDFDVLRSNDWDRFRPRALVVEILDQDLATMVRSPVAEFLSGLGYSAFAKLNHSVVFLLR